METDNKHRIKVSISLHKDDIEMLDKLAEVVGVNRSELIKRMTKKFSKDKKGQYILRAGYITSHNVHDVNKENGGAEPRNAAGSSSLEPTENIQENLETHNIESTLKEWSDLFHGELMPETYKQCPSAFLARIETELMQRYKIYKRDVNQEISYEEFRKNWRTLSEAWRRNIQEQIEIAKAPWVNQND